MRVCVCVDFVQRLRGHEYIDYHQLGLAYKFLLSDILINKALLYGPGSAEGQQAIGEFSHFVFFRLLILCLQALRSDAAK